MIDVDATLTRGDFRLEVAFQTTDATTGLFGHSGAGKSTLINIISGLERPTRGRVSIDGDVVFDASKGIDVPVHRRGVGVVFQEHRLFPHLSVAGNLRYGAKRARGGKGEPSLDDLLDLLEIRALLDRRVHELSGGERQRVALGRALLSAPRVLLLDEPLASLDHRLRGHILPLLDRVRRHAQIPMLYVSHELTEILRLTDDLVVLDGGQIAGQGRLRDLVHDARAWASLQERGVSNVLRLRVVEQRADEGNAVLTVGGEAEGANAGLRIIAPFTTAAPGSTVFISVRPTDIALAARPVEAVSIQNQLAGVVTRCTIHGGSALVETDVGVPILARVSVRSLRRLGIAEGGRITCLVKSNALRYIDAPA